MAAALHVEATPATDVLFTFANKMGDLLELRLGTKGLSERVWGCVCGGGFVCVCVCVCVCCGIMRGFTTELGVGQCVINRTEPAKVLSNEDQVYSPNTGVGQ